MVISESGNRNAFPFPLIESLSVVNSENSDPAKKIRADLPMVGRFASGQKKDSYRVLVWYVPLVHYSKVPSLLLLLIDVKLNGRPHGGWGR